LVVHGQEVCLPKRPRCGACPARSTCPRRGLPTHTPETVLSRAEMPSR
jgi:adenine-specific DNA glycosylase